MSTKVKLIKDLQLAGQYNMAFFVQNNKNPQLEKLINNALEKKRYLVFCKTCRKIFVDLPFKDFYKKHTFPEWDLWFCDVVLHWANDSAHSIYCFSDERNYDISSSLAIDCRNSSFEKVKIDVIAYRKILSKKKGKI